jgi:hypothetical protein
MKDQLKASELIKELKKQIKEHGDLYVCYTDEYCRPHVREISFQPPNIYSRESAYFLLTSG